MVANAKRFKKQGDSRPRQLSTRKLRSAKLVKEKKVPQKKVKVIKKRSQMGAKKKKSTTPVMKNPSKIEFHPVTGCKVGKRWAAKRRRKMTKRLEELDEQQRQLEVQMRMIEQEKRMMKDGSIILNDPRLSTPAWRAYCSGLLDEEEQNVRKKDKEIQKEKNDIELAWSVLMDPNMCFTDRKILFQNPWLVDHNDRELLKKTVLDVKVVSGDHVKPTQPASSVSQKVVSPQVVKVKIEKQEVKLENSSLITTSASTQTLEVVKKKKKAKVLSTNEEERRRTKAIHDGSERVFLALDLAQECSKGKEDFLANIDAAFDSLEQMSIKSTLLARCAAHHENILQYYQEYISRHSLVL